MAQYFFPQMHDNVSLAPSLLDRKRGVGTDGSFSSETRPSAASLKDESAVVDGDIHSSDKKVNGDSGLLNGHRPTNGERKLSMIDPAHFKTIANYKHVRINSIPPDPNCPYETITESQNPTVVPTSLLKQFHYAFLIRHPRYSIPSYYRCCIPPLDDMTGFHNFHPNEAGYVELRSFFDYCRLAGHIGPDIAGHAKQTINGDSKNHTEICLIDADDLLTDPEGVMKAFCKSMGIDWSPEMLKWNTPEDHEFATEAFEKWKGFHEDAIKSKDLKARGEHRVKTDDEMYEDWVAKYGEKGAEVIKQSVADNIPHYEYLKQFCMKV